MTQYICDIIGLSEKERENPNRVTPSDFLDWAETDLRGSDKRARGNAISNIKKMYHARMDEIISKTHLRYTHDWRPRFLRTEEKVGILQAMGIRYGNITTLVTSIRDKYEHAYLLPDLGDIRGYLDTAQLWSKNSYEAYNFQPVALIGLPLRVFSSTSRKPNGSRVGNAEFEGTRKVTYFWNAKKAVYVVETNGSISFTNYYNYSWKEMLRFEAPIIKRLLGGAGGLGLNPASLTDIYRRYLKYLSTV